MDLTPREQTVQEQLRQNKPLVYSKMMRYEERLARGESIAAIQFQYNYVCNFHCIHCAVTAFNNPNRRTMTPADVKNMCDQADEYGLAQFDLSGGEPLAFKELDAVLDAIGPERYYLDVGTNGWLMTEKMARHLKDLGVDRIQLSIDSLDAEEHDVFRQKPGSHFRAMRALQICKDAGLEMQVLTVVTPKRLHSTEFVEFLEAMDKLGGGTNPIPAKLSGEWEGRYDLLFTDADMDYFLELSKAYSLPIHLMPHAGRKLGCTAVKKIISVTAYGDVMPCIWMYFSLGNILDMPLREIIEKGMHYFGEYSPHCHVQDLEFNQKYLSQLIGRNVPVPIEQIMGAR